MQDLIDVLQRAVDLYGSVTIFKTVDGFDLVADDDGNVTQKDGPLITYTIQDEDDELDFCVWDSPELNEGASVKTLLQGLRTLVDG